MKKKILSQLFIVSFAFAGLFLVVQNVKADPVSPPGMKPIGRYCTMGMQWTGDWNDVAVMCSNCFPLFGYRSHGDGWNC